MNITIQEEIAKAPETVQRLFDEMLRVAEVLEISEEANQLKEAYLNANMVSSKH